MNSKVNEVEGSRVYFGVREENVREVVRVLFCYHERLLVLPMVYAQNWREAMREMQNNV
jgi:hypothetical protein